MIEQQITQLDVGGFWGTLGCLVRLPFRLAISVVMVFASIGVLIASIALDVTPEAIESIEWMFHRIWHTPNREITCER